MYTVYKIINCVNNKMYIGSSINVYKRWNQHKIDAKKKNYPLYNAMNKYGIDNFKFEIIREDFETVKQMQQFEKEMIIFYNTLIPNGYNQTLYTENALQDPTIKQQIIEQKSQKCAKVDLYENIIEKYSSYQEAGRKNNLINSASNIRLVCKGFISSCNGNIYRDLDENDQVISKPILPHKAKKPVVAIDITQQKENQYFTSISEASKKLNIERARIQKCIQGNSRYTVVHNLIFREIDINGDIIENNVNINEKLNQYIKRNPIINGEQHSISEWSKIYNISIAIINARIRNGWDSVKAITTPVKGR